MKSRDWLHEASWIARYLPGLGNPLNLSIDEFNKYLFEIVDILKNENASMPGDAIDHRSYVEAQMRKL